MSGVWASLFIYLGTFVIAFPVLVRRYHELFVTPYLLLAIMIASGWCNVAFILAIIDGEIVRVILLFYLSPIWSTILARFVLKEELTLLARLTIILAIIGAMTMLWSPDIGYPWPASSADWLALSSGIAFALANLFIHLARRTSIQVKTSVAWVGVVVIASLMIVIQSPPLQISSISTVFSALLVGVILMSIMTFCVVYGVTHMPIHRSAVILLSEIVAAAVSAYLLTDERMSLYEWTGGSIVILAAYLAARQQKNTTPA
ncbi:MAG: DMT family transporter [Thioalkalispiraceae bacterium]